MPMFSLYLNQLHATRTRGNLYSVPECAFRTYSLYYTEKIPFMSNYMFAQRLFYKFVKLPWPIEITNLADQHQQSTELTLPMYILYVLMGMYHFVCVFSCFWKQVFIDEITIKFQIGTVAGITAPLLAIFGNGIIYRYSQGRQLCIDDLSNPKLIR